MKIRFNASDINYFEPVIIDRYYEDNEIILIFEKIGYIDGRFNWVIEYSYKYKDDYVKSYRKAICFLEQWEKYFAENRNNLTM